MIYTTDVTKSIMRPALTDSIKVLRSDAKKKKQPVIYDERDIENTIIKVRGCNYNAWISVREHVDVMFLSNGHLYGASMILVKISYPGERDINILFTGDYNNKNTFIDYSKRSFISSLVQKLFDAVLFNSILILLPDSNFTFKLVLIPILLEIILEFALLPINHKVVMKIKGVVNGGEKISY